MNDIIIKLKERLGNRNINTKDEYRHELREITQELVLAGLSRTDFFNHAIFHGGTSLRMIYRINRYSEDLDFTLESKNTHFQWKPYLDEIKEFAGQIGCNMEASDKSKENTNVKKAFVKDSSIEQMMQMSWMRRSGTQEKIKIKLEIDTNPPLHSMNEIKTYSFPVQFNLRVQNLPSLFAGKCHALLCREYAKGRDWFDLQWFISKEIEPNYKYLNSMLSQQGPWKGQNVSTDKMWVSNELSKKSNIINLDEVNYDIQSFTNSASRILFAKDNILDMMKYFNSTQYGQNNRHKGNSR